MIIQCMHLQTRTGRMRRLQIIARPVRQTSVMPTFETCTNAGGSRSRSFNDSSWWTERRTGPGTCCQTTTPHPSAFPYPFPYICAHGKELLGDLEEVTFRKDYAGTSNSNLSKEQYKNSKRSPRPKPLQLSSDVYVSRHFAFASFSITSCHPQSAKRREGGGKGGTHAVARDDALKVEREHLLARFFVRPVRRR